MRGFGRGGWAGVLAGMLAAAVLLAAGGASAAPVKVSKVKTQSLTAFGSLTYTWSGDPAHGCAAAGVCGIRGELILRPQSSGGIVMPVGAPINVFLSQAGPVRVVREEGGAIVGECVDMPGSSFELLSLSRPGHRARTATIDSPSSSGRCAGPTSHDLAAVSIPVRRTAGGRSFDLSGTRSFAAGPFSGTLVSTMRLFSAPGSSQSEGFSSSGPGRSSQPAQAPPLELVQLRYRVSTPGSEIQTQFSGAADPSCQIADACGTSGSLAFSVQPSRTFTLFGQRVVHTHLSRRQVLNDLRRGRLSLNLFALLAGRVSETFKWPGGASCSDAVATPSLLLNTGFPQSPTVGGRKVSVTISGNGGPGGDVFRTHCPGPDDADLFGESSTGRPQTYAQGSITTAQLLAKRSVLTLSRSGSFSGLGYTGSRAGSISLHLTLIKVTAHTSR